MSKINWMEWSEEAFRRAEAEDKPILLAIGATWCHWCHVMDDTTYSDPSVAQIINSEFVPIRVDNDRRPDINERYNMGGWPTTCFLTPKGEIIAGATYIPPSDMVPILQHIIQHFRSNRKAIEEQSKLLEQHSKTTLSPRPDPTALLTEAVVEDVTQAVLNSYDPIYGGFGTHQKFPAFDALELLLHRYYYTGDIALLNVVRHSLEAQRNGGMYDHEEGGFFRYSTTRDWSIPHYEKMLEDHAGHIRIYTEAYRATGDHWFLDVAKHSYSYVEKYLYDPNRSVFFGSQDADEHYYSLPLSERKNVRAPAVDTTIYVDWNSRMVSALVSMWIATGEQALLDTAVRCYDWLLANCRDDSQALYHYHDGSPHLPGLLRDQAAAAMAALHLYEATTDEKYLDTAIQIVQFCRSHLQDTENGGFFDAPPKTHQKLGRLALPQKHILDNSLISILLNKLHILTADQDYQKDAAQALRLFLHHYKSWGHLAAGYALAVECLLSNHVSIRVIGQTDSSLTREFINIALHHYHPNKTVQFLRRNPAQTQQGSAEAAGKTQPSAYVCIGQTCLPPITDPENLKNTLRTGLINTEAT